MTHPTPIIDAAMRATCCPKGCVARRPDLHCQAGKHDDVRTALRAALPKDPPAEWIEWVSVAVCCGDNCDAANACSGHDLSPEGYAERYGCLSKERQDAALAVYRAQPLWIELWGDESCDHMQTAEDIDRITGASEPKPFAPLINEQQPLAEHDGRGG